MRGPSSYAHQERLVEPDWLESHFRDPSLRVVECSNKPEESYRKGHIPRAVLWRWKEDLWEPNRREFISGEAFAELMGRSGIAPETTVVLYGDSNRYATYALWFLTLRGHRDARILNGGRRRWVREGRPLTNEVPSLLRGPYRVGEGDASIRIRKEEVLAGLGRKDRVLLDVRSPEEFRGERVAPPHMLDHGAERKGRIPGAVHLYWQEIVGGDERFKPLPELRELFAARGVTEEKEVVVYCRLSHRASLVWFALRHLVGHPRVSCYDGSWTEWGSAVGVPIEV
ncbi:MAG: sulfurtransferase [Nitrospinota bacterium]